MVVGRSILFLYQLDQIAGLSVANLVQQLHTFFPL